MVHMMWISSVLLFTLLGIQHSHSVQDVIIEEGLPVYPYDAFTMDNGRELPEIRNLLRKIIDLRHKTIDGTEMTYRLREQNEFEENIYQIMVKKGNPRKTRKGRKNKKNKKNKKNNKVRRKRFTIDDTYYPDNKWPEGRVNYQFHSDLEEYARIRILYVMQMFSQYTPVRFFHSSNKTYLNFVRNGGCWSYIGRVHTWNKQDISCCTHQTPDQRYCNHEIGHALGMYHEHQNKYGTDFFRTNDMAVSESWKQWFHPIYGPYRYYDHKIDLDSPMAYSHNDFSQSATLMKSITLFDDKYDLILGNYGDRQLLYYLYKELNELYGVSTLCPGFTCDFDGYTALENGVCLCECPTGLSSTASPACSDIEVDGSEGDDLAWPENVVLIRVNGANPCPVGFTSDHWFEMKGGPHAVLYDTIYNFDADISSPPDDDKVMKIGLCYRNSDSSNTTWPKGSYCINPKNGTCPPDFYEGTLTFNNGGEFATNGLPDGITVDGSQTTIKFCCRNDSHYSMPAVFPTNYDFILWPLTGQCQEVDGMEATFQYAKYHNNGAYFYGSGLTPRMDTWNGITLFLCHYITRTSNCGGAYTLDSNNREVNFKTPNYPDNYPERHRCTWAFKADPGNLLRLVFHDFGIAMNPDGTADDEVEIRDIKIGNWGPRYIGVGRLQHHLSTENYLSVILYSNHNNTAKGLNATVTLIDNTVLCYSGRGENYDGKRNITKNFKQCLDWTIAAEKGAPHHPFAYSNLQDSLQGNYCRFPKDGLAPWCYVDFNGGFKREYCDVCNLQGCFDNDLEDCSANLTLKRFCSINNNSDLCQATCNCEDPSSTNCTYNNSRSDCQSAVDSLQPFYDTEESINHCTRSAGYCDQMEAELLNRTCDQPDGDLSRLIDAKSVYDLGDVIHFSCPNSSKTSNWTCSSTGKWIINSLCEIETSCPADFKMIGDNCYKLIEEVDHAEGKVLCEAENAKMVMMKSEESLTLVDALMSVFTSMSKFWIDLQDVNNNDQFEWGDGTPLTFTKWRTKPLVVPDECRIIDPNTTSVYSTRSVSKYGNPCLNWALEEVVNASGVNNIYHSYCAEFSLSSPELHCYVNDSGDIVRESCGVIPYCYNDSVQLQREPIPRESNFTYQGKQMYANDYRKCKKWIEVNDPELSLTDADFIDGSMADANNYCRSPNNTDYSELWCYVGTSGLKQFCNEPLTPCANTDCYTWKMKIDGTYTRLLSWRMKNVLSGKPCMPWKDTGNSWYDTDNAHFNDTYSVENAGSYCRPLYIEFPWCITSIWPPYVYWNYCDSLIECCPEEGYERPYDYKGKRDYAWNTRKCMKWIDVDNLPYTDDSFPDNSIALAEDYCRAPDNGDHLFCYVFYKEGGTTSTKREWCDVPMERNIKDCVYYDRDDGMWKPTYCDDVHDVICEKPVNVPACKDTNEAKCIELFEARPQECKSNSSYFGEDACRRTCGLCTDMEAEPNTDECTEPTLNADIIKVTNSTTVQVGYYFEYECPAGKVAKGNLKRGCLPDLNLTGVNPSCINQSEVDEWVNNSTMRERSFVEPGKILVFMENDKNKIQKSGYLKSWSFFSQSKTNLTFYVLRKNPTDNNFTVVNYTKVTQVQSFRPITLQLPVMNQFAVEAGDYIGWVMLDSSEGGIPYDTCKSNINPDDFGQRRNVTSVTNYALPANRTSFLPGTKDECRRYSLTALIGPKG